MFCFMLISTADKHGEKENHVTVCKHKFNATPSWMKHQPKVSVQHSIHVEQLSTVTGTTLQRCQIYISSRERYSKLFQICNYK